MPLDFGQPEKLKRDRRLRRYLLENLENAKRFGPTGEIDGTTLAENAELGLPPMQQFENEDHAKSLIRDLVAKQLVTERCEGLRRGQTHGLTHMRLKITAKGTSLLNESIDIDPDIDDERIEA